MSQVYSTEPQTSGSVVFETTHGPLSIHLWCKECSYTVRFFLQLCVDGFYDNLVFHRIIPNFLIQTGDAHFRQVENGNGTDDPNDGIENNAITPWRRPPPKQYRQQHQASEALDRRQYELNSRIRFNHRGQIAMALGNDNNDDNDDDDDESNSKSFARLQPQFFITLEEASNLDGKHVCFGGITGPTIFNALRIGQTDIFNNDDADDVRNFQPRIMSEAPRILRTKILQIDLPLTLPALAPTQDRSMLPWRIDPKTFAATSKAKDLKKRKKKNRKGVKNINLLSFGEEMNDDEEGNDNDEPNETAKRILSSHDVLTTKSLSKQKTEIVETLVNQTEQVMPSVKNQPSKMKNETSKQSSEDDFVTNDNLDSSDSHIPTFSSRKDRILITEQTNENLPATAETNSDDHSASDTKKKKMKEKQKKISLVEARRAKYAMKNSNRKGSTKQQREDETMAKFKAFQQKITTTTVGESGADEKDASAATAATATYHGQILERDVDSKDWIKTKFKCKKHMDHDAKNRGGDGRRIDDYEVVEERSSATDRKPGKRKRHRPGT
jgi:peptidyl-prolyl cis-trans isomerase SDCCAG10